MARVAEGTHKVPADLTELKDEELARQARAGSLASFEELVCRYESRLFGFLFRCCRNPDDARELTQTAFIAAHRALDQYRPDRPFGAWLYTIARRKLIDHLRAARPTVPLEEAGEDPDAADPSALMIERERRRDLWARIQDLLAPGQFQALWLHYQEDLSVREIARVLGRSETSVKVLMFRGRQALLKASASLHDHELTQSPGRCPGPLPSRTVADWPRARSAQTIPAGEP